MQTGVGGSIDLLAFTAFHLSLDGEVLCYIDGLMSLGVKTQVLETLYAF